MVKFGSTTYRWQDHASEQFLLFFRMIFHINRVAYFETLNNALKITWCVISLLAHRISKQCNEPLSADKSCQNRPIIGYTRDWSTGTSFCSKVLQAFPPYSTPSFVFCLHLFALSPRSKHLKQGTVGLAVWAAIILIQIPIETIQWFSPDVTDFSIYGHVPYWSPSGVKFM